MSVIFMCCCTALTLFFASFTTQIAEVSSGRIRAQTAADSAALAAVAESTIAGTGAPEEVARTFARANGGELLRCSCEAGSTRVQVLVRVSSAEATATAEVDPSRLGPAEGRSGGMDPLLEESISRLLEAAHGAVGVRSSVRERSEQASLWRAALDRYGSPEVADDWVARPGDSLHERGLAVDLEGDLTLAAQLVDRLRLPLWRPMSYEPWHFELEGSRG